MSNFNTWRGHARLRRCISEMNEARRDSRRAANIPWAKRPTPKRSPSFAIPYKTINRPTPISDRAGFQAM